MGVVQRTLPLGRASEAAWWVVPDVHPVHSLDRGPGDEEAVGGLRHVTRPARLSAPVAAR